MPIPTVEPIKMKIESKISYQGTTLIAILVNIAMGEVKGMYEQTVITGLSILPSAMENITTKKAIKKR